MWVEQWGGVVEKRQPASSTGLFFCELPRGGTWEINKNGAFNQLRVSSKINQVMRGDTQLKRWGWGVGGGRGRLGETGARITG